MEITATTFQNDRIRIEALITKNDIGNAGADVLHRIKEIIRFDVMCSFNGYFEL